MTSLHVRSWLQVMSERGHELHVLTFDPTEIEGVVCHPLQSPSSRKWRYFYAIPQARSRLAEIQPDLVNVFYLTGYGALAAGTGFQPLALTAAGSDVLVWSRNPLQRLMLRFILARAALVQSVAPHISEQLIELGVPQGKIITLPYGIFTERYTTIASRREYTAVSTILSTRHLSPIYDIATLIRASQLVVRQIPDIRFLVVGEGPEKTNLEQFARELGLVGAVEFAGYVSMDELLRLMSTSQVYVSTSLSDGASVSLFEAMAAGLFPIVSAIPANRGWIQHGHNGMLFTPGDEQALAQCILKVCDNPSLVSQAAALNRTLVLERADIRNNAAILETHYKAVYERYHP